MEPANVEKLHVLLAGIIEKNCPESPNVVLRRIEGTTGIRIAALEAGNVERFLQGLEQEVGRSAEEWKAKFVIGVARNLVVKHL